MRYSAQRQHIYDVLASTDTHPDAQWVYNAVRVAMPDISLGTVYRNLSQLCDNGKAKRISAVDNVERFDACTHNHAHFVCKCCGAISDIATPSFYCDNAVGQVDNIEVMYYGTCNKCQNQTIREDN